jgi:chemotaxis protein methyltransferase CheR
MMKDEAEIHALIETIQARYGYDFSGYSPASLKRRIQHFVNRSRCSGPGEVAERVGKDFVFFQDFLSEVTVNVTEMFRDPSVYAALRREVLPVLRSYPSIRIWNAGCATGEEAYSVAILLEEEGLYDRALIYATDISPRAIARAKEGVYQADQLRKYTLQYQKAGGTESFSKYYTTRHNSVQIAQELKRNIVFGQHNLATDDVFSEIHVVLCRNVLIYFDKSLQARVLDLFRRTLVRRGYLCLGNKESVEHSGMDRVFETINKQERIYRRVG